ncbi:prolyl 4-hydroxylase subunit alpha-1-like isoform X2 [Hippocampus zosterae]|uniref:prolyl 4-hydroxylase subunit alpha-1-like isoform X2 n=1 Tax=Hippocampus zosterae TaxID=109293 RepID=UPI00223D542C|nr:prolyl 4-hydroxylase subunit alpha-1-like isoform X2 [Hippocampus zosterae]
MRVQKFNLFDGADVNKSSQTIYTSACECATDMAVGYLLLILISFSSAAEEFYTSIGHMTQLLYTEKELLASLDDYIRAEQSKLETVKRWSERLANMSAFAIQDPETFLSHPVNAFKLLKRMNREWRALEMLVRSNVSHGFVSNLTSRNEDLPDEGDLTGGAEALLRLQDTYQLDSDTMAKGELPGTSLLLSKLTVEDCFDVGMAAYQEEDFYYVEMWMAQALQQIQQGEMFPSVDPVTILDYHSYALYRQGDLEAALVSTKQLLAIDPENKRAQNNLAYFEYELAKPDRVEIIPTIPSKYLTTYDATVYKQLCRGESVALTPRRRSRLFCRYHDNHRHPNLLIAPFKEEDLCDVPRVVRYYDVASHREAEVIKKLAKPKLTRSKVRNNTDHTNVASRVRISQNCWLENDSYKVVKRLINRVGSITGLEMSTAEWMQIANYGVGGLYEPHIDFQGKEVKNPYEYLGTGNRIATWLLYLSHVEAGGATVFPRAGAFAEPIKGSAIFWYNLHPDGEGDHQTQHAACPVLVGSKWVANTWLHERGQEFKRRCDLQSSAEQGLTSDRLYQHDA